MFNIAGFHIPKQVAFKHQAAILEKIGWDHPGLKPLGHEKRLYTKALNGEDIEKQEEYEDCDRQEYLGEFKTKIIDHRQRYQIPVTENPRVRPLWVFLIQIYSAILATDTNVFRY